ncbi:MAG TPA: GAF domain-containing protein, partial [Thauera aminoaromatica]|nr:GAF domain-containing protein [Thauera aminoaromatica]
MNTSVSSAVTHRLAFFKGLQTLTNRIHASKDTDEIMLELAPELCSLFEAERFTIYALEEGGASIVTRVKTGLSGVQSIRLPIGENSIAGFVALSGQLVNIRDVYDDEELRRISPHLALRREVDASTGFHSRQMLVAPIRDPDTGSLLGVVQLINTLNREPFSKMTEEGLMGLAQTLGVAFLRHNRQAGRLRSRFEALVVDGRITAEEFADATREARESGAGTENLLIEQLGLSHAELGAAASRYFGVPYQPFVANHVKPMDLLRNIKREFVERSLWLPWEENPEGVVILCVDPEQVRSSGVAQNVLPKKRLTYRVTTQRDFELTVEQFFGVTLDDASVSDLLSGLDDHEEDALSLRDEVNAAADNELVKLVNKIIIDAYRQGASDIHIEPRPGKEKTQIRFRKDGSLV